MAHFPDLTPYSYGQVHPDPSVVHIGWLDGVHSYTHGVVPASLIEKLRRLSLNPVELYRGTHVCEICEMPEIVRKDLDVKRQALKQAIAEKSDQPMRAFMSEIYREWEQSRQSNGEIRIRHGAIVFAAPLLIVHYIEEHQYMPPQEFLEALEEVAEPECLENVLPEHCVSPPSPASP